MEATAHPPPLDDVDDIHPDLRRQQQQQQQQLAAGTDSLGGHHHHDLGFDPTDGDDLVGHPFDPAGSGVPYSHSAVDYQHHHHHGAFNDDDDDDGGGTGDGAGGPGSSSLLASAHDHQQQFQADIDAQQHAAFAELLTQHGHGGPSGETFELVDGTGAGGEGAGAAGGAGGPDDDDDDVDADERAAGRPQGSSSGGGAGSSGPRSSAAGGSRRYVDANGDLLSFGAGSARDGSSTLLDEHDDDAGHHHHLAQSSAGLAPAHNNDDPAAAPGPSRKRKKAAPKARVAAAATSDAGGEGGSQDGQKKTRHQVSNACTNCQKTRKKCSGERPCASCVRHPTDSPCVDSSRKKRPVGIKRGKYKTKNRKLTEGDDAAGPSSFGPVAGPSTLPHTLGASAGAGLHASGEPPVGAEYPHAVEGPHAAHPLQHALHSQHPHAHHEDEYSLYTHAIDPSLEDPAPATSTPAGAAAAAVATAAAATGVAVNLPGGGGGAPGAGDDAAFILDDSALHGVVGQHAGGSNRAAASGPQVDPHLLGLSLAPGSLSSAHGPPPPASSSHARAPSLSTVLNNHAGPSSTAAAAPPPSTHDDGSLTLLRQLGFKDEHKDIFRALLARQGLDIAGAPLPGAANAARRGDVPVPADEPPLEGDGAQSDEVYEPIPDEEDEYEVISDHELSDGAGAEVGDVQAVDDALQDARDGGGAGGRRLAHLHG